MKTKLEIIVHPFLVPPTVVITLNDGDTAFGNDDEYEGTALCNRFPISELSSEDLERLCSEFTSAVFKKAGKDRAPTCEPR